MAWVCWGGSGKLCPPPRRDGIWARPSRMLCTSGTWQRVGGGQQPGRKAGQAQGICGEQQVVWSDWLVGSQGDKAKRGQVVKSLRAGTAPGTFILLSWYFKCFLILGLKMETRDSSRMLDWKIGIIIRLHFGGGGSRQGWLLPPLRAPPPSVK